MTSRAVMQREQPTGDDLIGIPAHEAVLAELAAAQAGILSRRQAREVGISRRELDRLLATRQWRALGAHVLVTHNAALTDAQQSWAAVLFLDKPAALAGVSACQAGGLRGFEPERVHIVLAHDTHARVPAWVKLHESRRFTASDIVTGSHPSRTGMSRSVIDAAAWSRWPRRACAILCASVQQRLVTPQQLEAELHLAGRVRHAATLRDIIGDIAGGGHTLAEIDLGPLARRAGLATPRRQQLRREPNGQARYLDAEFDLPDGTVLVVEIDGAGHLDPTVWEDDLGRQNEQTIGRRPVLRFASVTVRLNGERVVDQLRRMRLAHTA